MQKMVMNNGSFEKLQFIIVYQGPRFFMGSWLILLAYTDISLLWSTIVQRVWQDIKEGPQ